MPRVRTRIELPYLLAWRTARYLSQQELADMAQMSKTTIVRLEAEADATGQRQTAIPATVGKLARAMGITRQQLVEQDPDRVHS